MSSHNRSRTTDRFFVSPDAPTGGGGPGHFRQSASTINCHGHASMPAHGSPAARRMTPQDHQRASTLRRAKCVYAALCKAQSRVGPAIKEETGCALGEALSGILPAVVMMVGVMAGSAALGGVAGAAIGSFAGGVGAIPGAAAGATAGTELGMLLLNALGIGFLAVYIIQHIAKVFDLATQGVKEAWDAPSSPMPTSAKIDHASRSLARAVAVFIRLILEGIVLYLLAKGTAVTARRVSEVSAKLRASKLGVRLAEYVERNWKALVENPKLNKAVTSGAGANKSSYNPQYSTQGNSKAQSLEAKQVADIKQAAFETKGIKLNPEAFPEGRLLIEELEASGLSRDRAVSYARGYIESGSTIPIPKQIDSSNILYKLVPEGTTPSSTTGYWLSETEARLIMDNPSGINGKLGLPSASHSEVFDVFTIRPRDNATVFESTIASTVEGNIIQKGGVVQTIVPKRSLFTIPEKLSITINTK